MRNLIKSGLLAVFFSVSIAAPVIAGPFENGEVAFTRGDYATALSLFRPLADQGNAEAQVLLGDIYATGSAPEIRGIGQAVPKNYAEAVKWYRKAARQGNPFAEFDLGVMYRDGQGVPQDYVHAHMFFNLAAAAGNVVEAVKDRDLVAKLMTPQQIAEAQKLACDCQARKLIACD